MHSRPRRSHEFPAIEHRSLLARDGGAIRLIDGRAPTRPCAAVVLAMLIAASVGACTKPPGWSADERQRTRDLCLTQVGTALELDQTRHYCDCVVAKTIEQYPSHVDQERLGTDDDAERYGDACAKQLALDKPAGDAAASADAAAQEPRIYGEWQVEFVPHRAGVDEADTWQAIGLDARDGSARLAYVCDSDAYCGFVFQPPTACDASSEESVAVALLFSLPNGRRVAQTDAKCLPNGAWGFVSVDSILERFRDQPDEVKLTLRGESWDFSLDGAMGAFTYCERAAAGGQGGADAGATGDSTAPPPR